jgi:hypothetical protein
LWTIPLIIEMSARQRHKLRFMQDEYMGMMQSGSRRETRNLGRFIVERDPGPLNYERWAGDFKWDIP